MFGIDVNKIAEDKIAGIIRKTAEENGINETEVNFILKLDNEGKVLVIPYYNKQKHPVMRIKEFFD